MYSYVYIYIFIYKYYSKFHVVQKRQRGLVFEFVLEKLLQIPHCSCGSGVKWNVHCCRHQRHGNCATSGVYIYIYIIYIYIYIVYIYIYIYIMW